MSDTGKNRLAICKSCEEFNNTIKMCAVCKCFMPVKTRLAFAECPKQKWGKDFTPGSKPNGLKYIKDAHPKP
jgi:hypothetical protein